MQFLQQDTVLGKIENPLSRNLYAYGQGNPVKFTDPSGQTPIQVAFAAIGAIAGWYFGDYVAKKLGYSSGPKYWAVRTAAVVGGAALGWFAGGALVKVATGFLMSRHDVMAKMPNIALKALGLDKIAARFAEATNAWGISANGVNQGTRHFFEYWRMYPDRMPSIAKSLGLDPKVFSNTVEGFINFTRATLNIIKNPSLVKTVGDKTIYFVHAVNDTKNGVMVIVYDGKIQTVMKTTLKYFLKQ